MTASKSNIHHMPTKTGKATVEAEDNRRWPNSLRILRRARGLTLEQLAELSDVSVSYLSRLEAGLRRLNADTIDKLTHALGCEAAELMQPPPMISGKFAPSGHPGAGSIPPLTGLAPSAGFGRTTQQPNARDLPVYGRARVLGPSDAAQDSNVSIDFKKPIEWLYRPADLAGVDAAFALYISDESMSPKFTTGDVIITHPFRPPVEGSYVVVVSSSNDVVVRQFVKWNDTTAILRQLHDGDGKKAGAESEFILSDLRGIYRVITTVEGH